jgi:hypothetical protein
MRLPYGNVPIVMGEISMVRSVFGLSFLSLLASGALAADGGKVMPERADFLHVCDAYGIGFFYIAGSEVCLHIDGYVRHDLKFGLFGADLDGDFIGDTYSSVTRAALRLDARSETDLGSLRSYIQINFDVDNAGADDGQDTQIENAYVEIGGLRVGFTDSLFTSLTYYAGGVLRDDIVGYGPFGTNQIAYTFSSANGFSVSAALEQGYGAQVADGGMPHIVAGAAYTQNWGALTAVGAYDSVSEEWAGKARIDVTFSPVYSAFIMAGLKSDDSPPYAQFYGVWGGEWAVWAGGTAKVSETTALNAQLSLDDDENFAAVANVVYEMVPGFSVTPEVGYYENFDIGDSGDFGGMVRFRRLF